jgi:hypothetical protein
MHTIAICPTAPQRVFFDEHCGMKMRLAVSAHSTGGGDYESNGIAFEDYARMGTQQMQKLFSGRRTTVPVWAINNTDLQRVLVKYLEVRCGSGRTRLSEDGTLLERLQRAEKFLIEHTPQAESRLDVLCARYVARLRDGADSEELDNLRKAINGLDTQLIINRTPARIAAAAVYKFYREGLKSTQIADDLGLHSAGVRQMLLRIHKAARALGYPDPERITSYPDRRPVPSNEVSSGPPRGKGYYVRTEAHRAACSEGQRRFWEKRRAAQNGTMGESRRVENVVPPSGPCAVQA